MATEAPGPSAGAGKEVLLHPAGVRRQAPRGSSYRPPADSCPSTAAAADIQMDIPHLGTNSPTEYTSQHPPVTPQEPGHTGYPKPKGAYSESPTDYTVPPPNYPVAVQPRFPIQNQPVYANQPDGPTGVSWMPAPSAPLNCPPGLEYLSQVDQILIHQQIELLEVLTGFETNNKFEIKNSLGQRVYFAVEDTGCCTRNCCGPCRPFTLRILDNLGQEVITMERPLRCDDCCCPCCLQEIEIQAPPGVPIGYITQKWHPYLPKYAVQNEKREDVLKITGPCVACRCCTDIDFKIKSLDEETVVGKITKHWTGFLREAFTDADNFGIQFPLDLDVKMKAAMLGACFLIDFMFFEELK